MFVEIFHKEKQFFRNRKMGYTKVLLPYKKVVKPTF